MPKKGNQIDIILTDSGRILVKSGYFTKSKGVCDSEGTKYPVGFDKEGIMYSSYGVSQTGLAIFEDGSETPFFFEYDHSGFVNKLLGLEEFEEEVEEDESETEEEENIQNSSGLKKAKRKPKVKLEECVYYNYSRRPCYCKLPENKMFYLIENWCNRNVERGRYCSRTCLISGIKYYNSGEHEGNLRGFKYGKNGEEIVMENSLPTKIWIKFIEDNVPE